ncbi:sulfotransferase [Thiorhodococcus mannitoliphagus]|uniref:Sulfotransferase n=1 Tax=Thiorhodococcus mannitoliphagus TaxID=329406 RepID=A0A6P1DY44_9GAMM|nr:sulfotransferase [Thiorhodococcus mannitoliphagus]NEX22619.1 sulfotransferase [Thiorhodococcus mannitoliphagus]
MRLNKEFCPVFLLGSHKSGSSLLRSLLDGHESLNVLPSETHFFQYSGQWVDYAIRKNTRLISSLEDSKTGLYQFLKNENIIKDPYGASDIAGKYDEEIFRSRMNKYEAHSLSELLQIYFMALHYSLKGGGADSGKYVEKSVENAEFACTLAHWFPDAKFVHIVRNPYATFTALRKMKSKRGYPLLRPLVESLSNSYQYLFKNKLFGKEYLIIRYEDLVENTTETMIKVAEHLNIKFSDCLLNPTLLGVPWKGNSTYNKEFSGISNTSIDQWKNTITDLELLIVNSHFRAVIDEFGYVLQNPKHSQYIRQLLEPAKYERLRIYVLNRAFTLSHVS